MRQARQRTGYTLIELLIVIVVLAILATLANASYRHAVLKSKRVEGRTALLTLMQQQEQVFAQRMTYLAFSAGTATPPAQQFKWYSGATPATSAYEIEATPCTGKQLAECVLLTAHPGTGRVDSGFVDLACGRLRLDSIGRKWADGNDCW
ncbi:type IV pilus assembly protein PilE [Actimicrobium sp. GrIS 1.19]|uniref:type IV pilin protein n=1 Tax=Actimicrobium sp. GrIS 1.19 TaxID=3071708 RepID=UPI002DF9D118|nr:type IV pilus assembly protein PilE [Actimicrobium sp. GrIS 1.19]